MSGEPETHKLDTHELIKFIDQLTQDAADEQRAQLSVVAAELPRARPRSATPRLTSGDGSETPLLTRARTQCERTARQHLRIDSRSQRRLEQRFGTHEARGLPQGHDVQRCEEPTGPRVHVLFPPLRRTWREAQGSGAAPTAGTLRGLSSDGAESSTGAPFIRSRGARMTALLVVSVLTCGLLSLLFAERQSTARAGRPPALPTVPRRIAQAAALPEPTAPAPVARALKSPATDSLPSRPATAKASDVRPAPGSRSEHERPARAPAIALEVAHAPARARHADAMRTVEPGEAASREQGRAVAHSTASLRDDSARQQAAHGQPDSLTPSLRRRAVDALLAGRTREALEIYRTLLRAGEEPAVLSELVRMLEDELRACEQEGAPACGR